MAEGGGPSRRKHGGENGSGGGGANEEEEDEEKRKRDSALESAIVREKPDVKWSDVAGLDGAKEVAVCVMVGWGGWVFSFQLPFLW